MTPMRERFERWLCDDFYDGLMPPPEWEEDRNCYTDFATHLAWKAFCAASTKATE